MPLFTENLILYEANAKVFPFRNTKQIQQCYHIQNHYIEFIFLYILAIKNLKMKLREQFQSYQHRKEKNTKE